MPIRFWGLVIQVVVYLMNRLPSASIDDKSPYELLFSKAPLLVHLRVLGCLCYASILPKADKFSERAIPAVLMGYSTNQKGYLLLDLSTNKLYIPRRCVFIFQYEKSESFK